VIAQIEVGDERIRVFSDKMAFAAGRTPGMPVLEIFPDFVFPILYEAGGPVGIKPLTCMSLKSLHSF
jgi:hypothetical protein